MMGVIHGIEAKGRIMLLKLLRAKIHRATVTEACVDYVGSITIDRALLEASGMLPGESVLVADLTDGHLHQRRRGPAGGQGRQGDYHGLRLR
jgi:hypothetical protein